MDILRPVQPWQVGSLSFTDASSPYLLQLKFNPKEANDPDTATPAASVTIDANGGDVSSFFKLTLTTGTSTYVITGSATDTNDATATTLDALVNAINRIGMTRGDHWGWEARRKDGYKNESLATGDQHIDTTITRIVNKWTDVLQKDMSAVAGAYASGLGLTVKRLVNPDYGYRDADYADVQMRVPAGHIEIGRIDATIAFASTAPHIYVLDETGTVLYDGGALTTATAATATGWADLATPMIVRGPVMVGLHCPAVITGITRFNVAWRPFNR